MDRYWIKAPVPMYLFVYQATVATDDKVFCRIIEHAAGISGLTHSDQFYISDAPAPLTGR